MSNKKSRCVSQHKSRKNRRQSSSKTKKIRNYRIRGGSTCSNFSNLPIHHYYPMNNYQNDVQGAQIASRLQPGPVYGGKQQLLNVSRKNKNQNRKNQNRKHKMKGGNLVDSLNNLAHYTSVPFRLGTSAITDQGNISSGINGPNILYGYQTSSNNITKPIIPDYLV